MFWVNKNDETWMLLFMFLLEHAFWSLACRCFQTPGCCAEAWGNCLGQAIDPGERCGRFCIYVEDFEDI